MKATNHEMAIIKFTKKEFEELLQREVMTKYPYLFKDLKWEWEDFYIAKDIPNTTFADDTVAIELTFSKREEPLKAVDSRPDVVYIAVNEVCR